MPLIPILSRSSRAHGLFALALGVVGACYLWLNWLDELGSLHGDGLIYFLTAMEYAPYRPDDPLAEAVAGVSQFPPGYAFLLMLTGGASSFLVAHAVTAVLLAVGVAAFYAWLMVLGLGRARAAVGAILLAILPGTFLQSFYLHPEGLYIALAFAGLAWLELGERTARPAWFWAASVVFALALLTRTAGVTLLPGLAIVLLRCRPRGWPLMAAVTLSPTIAWSLVHSPEMSYTEALVAKYTSGAPLGAVLNEIGNLVLRVGEGLVWNVVQGSSLIVVAAVLGVAAATVGARRFFQGKADAWYVAAYLGVLAIWPYPQEAWRLSWVIVPILLGWLLMTGDALHARAGLASPGLRATVRWLPALALALAVLPGTSLLALRAVNAVNRGEPQLRHVPGWYDRDPVRAYRLASGALATVEALRRFAPLLPEAACLHSSLPLVTAYFTDRNTSYTPREATDDETFERELARSGCRYVVMLAIPTRYDTPLYPKDRLGARLEMVAEHRLGEAGADGPVVAMLGLLREPAP